MSSPRVAVVSGSNKGIGFAIVKSLAQNLDNGIVYLTARNADLGQKAVSDLKSTLSSTKSEIKFHQLDITDLASIQALKDYLVKNHGGIDILVNNAGFAFKNDATESFGEQAKVSVDINYIGTLNVCKAMFPILRSHARVVNVSSQAGLLKIVTSEEIRNCLLADNLSMTQLDKVMAQFVESAKAGNYEDFGFPKSAYGMSKVGVTAMTRVLQREIDADNSRTDIIVTACCPGYVDTDMSSHKGSLTPDEGAVTPCYLALVPDNWSGPKGHFYFNKKEKDWLHGEVEFTPKQ